jgi:glycosyltransferase involved in cell wall biosynthesis
MRLLRLPAYFEPEQAASSFLWQNLSEDIAKAGVDEVVYTPTPTRGVTEEVRKYYKSHHIETKHDGRMVVHRFSLYGEGKNPILRAMRYVLQGIIQFNKAVFAKDARSCNVMFIASTPPIQGALAAMVKKCRRDHIPFVYNLQDIFPDSLVGTGLAKKDGLLWKIGRHIENFTYRNADKIIVISQDFKRNIMAKGVPEEKIEVVYNWVDENAITPVKDEENELFEEFGISRDKFRVVYAGNLGNAQNIEIIVNATRRLKNNPQIEFIIFGKGGLEDEIKAAKAKEQLDNLKILPLQPYERVAKVYGLGHVCIVACKPGLGGAAMPSKTWSIMSSGRAVLANFDEGELKEIVEGGPSTSSGSAKPCGVFTKAGDLEGFVAAIDGLSQHPERCVEMGRNGRQFILENLTREVGTKKYVEVIKSVVKE